MEKRKDRREIVRFLGVAFLLGFALIIDQPLAGFFVGVGTSVFWAPIFAFAGTAILGYFLFFVFPSAFLRHKK